MIHHFKGRHETRKCHKEKFVWTAKNKMAAIKIIKKKTPSFQFIVI